MPLNDFETVKACFNFEGVGPEKVERTETDDETVPPKISGNEERTFS